MDAQPSESAAPAPLGNDPAVHKIRSRHWPRIQILLPLGVLVSLVCLYLVITLSRASAQANVVKCRKTLRSLGSAMLLYTNENRGTLPPSMGALLLTQDISAQVFVCPGSGDRPAADGPSEQRAATIDRYDGHSSYRYFGVGRQLQSLPAGFVLAYELPGNHAGQTCVLYADGSVTAHPDATARMIIADVEAGRNPPTVK